MDTAKKIYIFLVIITTVVVLIYAQSIIIPFVLAVLFWVLIRVIKKLLSKVGFISHWSKWVLTIISSVLLLSLLLLAIQLISKNIQELSNALPVYQQNVTKVTSAINERFNIDVFTMITDYGKDVDFAGLLSSLLSTLTGLFGSAFTVLLYLVFILLEEPIFPKKLKAMYPNKERYEHIKDLVDKIDHSIGSYIALKTVVSLVTGFLSYFALLFIGVDAPLFWAFLIFVLNFIPTVGSLIATIFPAFFAILQFGTFTPGFLVLGIVGSIQLVVGNFIEPKLMGNTLNISPLVVFLTLAIWGVIWGITGMLLSVPITVILIIIMSEFKGTRPLAVLLSQQGKLNE
jgi:predicted PurR-regulated permease PerM